LWDIAGNSKQAGESHLAYLGSQSDCKIQLILPVQGASHTIKYIYIKKISIERQVTETAAPIPKVMYFLIYIQLFY